MKATEDLFNDLQSMKRELPIVFSEKGREIYFNDKHPMKQLPFIDVIENVIVYFLSLLS